MSLEINLEMKNEGNHRFSMQSSNNAKNSFPHVGLFRVVLCLCVVLFVSVVLFFIAVNVFPVVQCLLT